MQYACNLGWIDLLDPGSNPKNVWICPEPGQVWNASNICGPNFFNISASAVMENFELSQ